jgi:SHS2 domain-containing protein
LRAATVVAMGAPPRACGRLPAVAGHRQIEHTADVAFELWGASLGALLGEAARAVVALLTDGRTPDGDDRRDVELAAFDDADRLVRWLNEVLYLALVEGFLVNDATLEITPGGLRGQVRGRADARDAIVTEVKSATYHDLVVRNEGDRWFARVVMDV